MSSIIVRMPPSPTGYLHLGTARTALFNYLFAKKNEGEIVFRWEDTDKERSKPEFEAEILEGLKWLGMDFETESKLFVRQTDFLTEHTQKINKLWEEGKVFPCFVSSDEIEQTRQKAQTEKLNFVFWSPYREFLRTELQKKMESGIPYVWRLRCPKNEIIAFNDLIRGNVRVNSDTIGDFVVARSDGTVLYLLANVFDDESQKITHVIRGEDHISNTPKQILLWEALKISPPKYAHIPLVLDAQKRKLSKRHTDPSVCVLIKDFQAQGFLPEAVCNGLVFLGWNPKNTTDEIFSLSDLSKIFDLSGVNPAAAQYNFEKMKWYNQQWNAKFSAQELGTRFLAWTKQYDSEIFDRIKQDTERVCKIIAIVSQKQKIFAEFWPEMVYFYDRPIPNEPALASEKMNVDILLAKIVLKEMAVFLQSINEADFSAENLKAKLLEKILTMNLKNGQVLWPLRVALSGRERSVSPFEIADILGKTESLERIHSYLDL